jgi:serine protease AprX
MTRRTVLLIALFAAIAVPALAAGHGGDRKLDPSLRVRAHVGRGTSRVIIRTADGLPADALIAALKGKPGRRLPLLRSQVAEVPDRTLDALAENPRIAAVSLDRAVTGTIEPTADATGATWARANLGVDGSGVGVAIVDSGVTAWHDDLGSDRVVHFADFVDFQPVPYDDYGHGTHVAGIIAGNGYDSGGARRGMAPGASLIVLKVLDGDGNGYISNVIAALDYAVENRTRFNIRVVNLSVAAGVYESYNTDPLTLAARRAVEAGIVVVTAAGNFGRNAKNQPQYGGITSPGNAPWVLTVGASTHKGTTTRADDEVAPFSSRGPSYIDRVAKPDLVAPGVGIESLGEGSSLLFSTHSATRLWGTVDTVTQPYLSLSGTSMAAPVVTGTVVLMLQANPKLTPNLVKAILQYTAEHRRAYDDLTQGAGFLNARGAVQLAKSFGGDASAMAVKDPTPWNAHINWGNHRMGGGALNPQGNAWRTDVMWGASTAADGTALTWGTVCDGSDCDHMTRGGLGDGNAAWETTCADSSCQGVVWGATFLSPSDDHQIRGAGCAALNPSCEDVIWPNGQPAKAAGSARAAGRRRGSL